MLLDRGLRDPCPMQDSCLDFQEEAGGCSGVPVQNFFKGQVRGFRTSRISIPRVLISIHIVLPIGLIVSDKSSPCGKGRREESCLQFCILKMVKMCIRADVDILAGVDF